MAHRIRFFVLLSTAMACIAGSAMADGSIETVVVTAEKRAEELKNVPMSITVVSGKDLDVRQERNFEDFVNSVPGLQYTAASPASTELTLRGISTDGVGSTVGILVDETPYGSSSALANGSISTPNLDTFDMARIEVLRGPQGTLYGASTLGGLLKFVTNPPDPSGWDDLFEIGGVDSDSGGLGWSARGMVNVPLTDDVAFRVDAYHVGEPGFIDDPGRHLTNTNGTDANGGRASLLYNATDKLSVRFTAVIEDLDVANQDAEDIVVTGPTYHLAFGPYQEERAANEFADVRYGVYNGTINWNLDWATLTSSTSYGTFHIHDLTDGTAIPSIGFGFVGARLAQDKFTQEIRLASTTGGMFDWLVGGYYTNEGADLHQDVLATATGPLEFFEQLNSRFDELAGFADLTWHATSNFDIQAGGRFSHDSQNEFEFAQLGALHLPLATGASSENVFTWSTAATYHLDADTSFYARIAKGWQPGGPNDIPIGTPPGSVPATFGPSSTVNYEAGVKSDLLDGRLSFDADAFFIDWSHIQVLVVVNHTGINANGGTAQSAGFEWDVAYRPIDPLQLRFAGSYTDAHLTSGTPPLVGASSGARLPFSPRWSFSLDGDYTFDSIGDFTPFIGASWRYIGSRESGFSPPNTTPPFDVALDQYKLSAYNTLEARLGVTWKDWRFEFYGRNLTNAMGITAFGPTGTSAASCPVSCPAGLAAPPGSVAVIPPREFGITLTGKI